MSARRFEFRRIRGNSGYSLVEVLVASLVFTVVFLMLFTLLGRMLVNVSGGDYLRAAQIVDEKLAEFYVGAATPEPKALVTFEGIQFSVLSATTYRERSVTLNLLVVRVITGDTLGTFYAERFLGKNGL